MTLSSAMMSVCFFLFFFYFTMKINVHYSLPDCCLFTQILSKNVKKKKMKYIGHTLTLYLLFIHNIFFMFNSKFSHSLDNVIWYCHCYSFWKTKEKIYCQPKQADKKKKKFSIFIHSIPFIFHIWIQKRGMEKNEIKFNCQ